jgi:hypothetical protein
VSLIILRKTGLIAKECGAEELAEFESASHRPGLASGLFLFRELWSFSAVASRRRLRQRQRPPLTNPALHPISSPNRFSFQHPSDEYRPGIEEGNSNVRIIDD